MKSEKLQKYALTAEIVGGIAVVVSLLFLIVETRGNTEAIHAQTYQALTSELNEWRALKSSELTDIQIKFRNSGPDSLSANEMSRYLDSVQALWGIYDTAFYAWERGVLGDQEWNRFLKQLCIRKNGPDREIWVRQGREISGNITEHFSTYVEDACTQ